MPKRKFKELLETSNPNKWHGRVSVWLESRRFLRLKPLAVGPGFKGWGRYVSGASDLRTNKPVGGGSGDEYSTSQNRVMSDAKHFQKSVAIKERCPGPIWPKRGEKGDLK
jgi:hypothetical protein